MSKKLVVSNYPRLSHYWGIGLKDKKNNIWIDNSSRPCWQGEPRMSLRIDSFSPSVECKEICFIIQENINDVNPFILDKVQTPWLTRTSETRTFYLENFLHELESSDDILFEKDYLIRAAICGKFFTELITLSVFRKYDTGILFYTDHPNTDENTLCYFFGNDDDEEQDCKQSVTTPYYSQEKDSEIQPFNKDIIKISDIEKITENPKTLFLINL